VNSLPSGRTEAARTRSPSLWLAIALIALPSLLLLALELLQAARVIPEIRESQAQVVHTLEVIAAAEAVRDGIQDMERGQRGFLITGDVNYLEPYQSGTKSIGAQVEGLRLLTFDNPDQQARIDRLQQELNVKLREMAAAIDAYRAQGFDAAREIVRTNVGSEAMKNIASLIASIIASENGVLRERQARAAQATQRDTVVTESAAALAVVVMALGALLLFGARRRAERDRDNLMESEERFRLLVEGVKDYAIFLLDPGGRIVSWNEGAERIKGYAREEIVGRHLSVFYTPESRATGEPERVLATATAKGSYQGEGWRVRKDGSRFWASVVVTALRDESANLRGFSKITRDLTVQRQHQQALERSQEELVQAQKMQAIGHLTGGVAHDFNNVLTAIIGSLEMIERPDQSIAPAVKQRLIETAKRAAEQGAALTQRLLAFARQQTLAPQTVELNRLVAGMSDLLRRTLGEAIAIETVLAAGLWRVRVDPNQFQSSLLNLALNARDAMPGGGKLTIETGNSYLEEEYAAANAEVTPGQYVLVAVTDTGTGMSRETMQRAFEPFFTTKKESEGTGLGLSQVFGFIKQSGGHVKLYSELGQGTTVRIYLPRYVGDEAPERPPERRASMPVAPDGEFVLLVEDDANVREFSANALEYLGYRVHEASDAVLALELLDQHKDIALMFTDVGLPGLSGRELADEARRRAPHLKILFTTGYARNAIVHNGVLDHGVELLAKPFTIEALGRKLDDMLHGAK
jgi:PAS domain S-box-containing protein